jgi:hypothetical protein
MRLGGARRNDSTLNGMSEGPDFPAAGTVLSVSTGLNRTEFYGGTLLSYTYSETTYTDYKEIYDVNLVANGSGGEYMDYSNGFNVRNKPANTVVATSLFTESSYLYFDQNSQSYENGYNTGEIRHDGTGSLYLTSFTTYNTTSVFYEGETGAYYELDGVSYQVGNATRSYSHNGQGGYTYSDGNTVYFSQGYVVGTGSSGINTSIGGNDYPIGSVSYEVHSNGLGSAEYANSQTSYYGYGTFIATYDGYNYYSDGYGGTYTESVPSYPSYGTTTGNTSNGTIYIDIYGSQYENGSYSGTEYNDGNGGYYWEYSNSYQYYGYEFTSGYYSDGNGGYYT